MPQTPKLPNPFSSHSTRRTFLRGSAFSVAGAVAAALFGRSFARDVAASPEFQLEPDVLTIIRGTMLEHASALPDPTERVSTLRLVLEGADRAYDADLTGAEVSMRSAVADDVSSRTAHAGLGQVLLEQKRLYGTQDSLEEAIRELVTADGISMRRGVHRTQYAYTVGRAARRLQHRSVFDNYFAQVLPGNETYYNLLGYGVGLRGLQDPRAESVLVEAHERHHFGGIDAAAELSTLLLTEGRLGEALAVLTPPSISTEELIPFVHLVRGVILEKQGHIEAARKEYEFYEPIAHLQAIPSELIIPGSKEQLRIRPIAGAATVTEAEMLAKFGRLVYTEANEDGPGGMRAAGWVVRTRVIQGACAGCISPIDNSGSTRWQKYWQVMTQSGPQFNIGNTSTQESNQVALTVYAGSVPDPHVGLCVAGAKSGNNCTGTCSQQTYDGAFSNSARVFFARSGGTACSGSPQFGCAPAIGKTCGNGQNNDNCFSRCP